MTEITEIVWNTTIVALHSITVAVVSQKVVTEIETETRIEATVDRTQYNGEGTTTQQGPRIGTIGVLSLVLARQMRTRLGVAGPA